MPIRHRTSTRITTEAASPLSSAHQLICHVFERGRSHQQANGNCPPASTIAKAVSPAHRRAKARDGFLAAPSCAGKTIRRPFDPPDQMAFAQTQTVFLAGSNPSKSYSRAEDAHSRARGSDQGRAGLIRNHLYPFVQGRKPGPFGSCPAASCLTAPCPVVCLRSRLPVGIGFGSAGPMILRHWPA